MGHDLMYLSLNGVSWPVWKRLLELTEREGDEETLRRTLCTLTLPGATESERTAAANFDSVPEILRPAYAGIGMRVDKQRFAPILVDLLTLDTHDEWHREHVREAILQLAFPDGGLRRYGQTELCNPMHLLAALIPPLRDEAPELGRLPPAPGDLVFGFRAPTANDLTPRTNEGLFDQPFARALGILLPVVPRPFRPVEPHTFPPDAVCELAAALRAVPSFDTASDPEFFAMVEAARSDAEDPSTIEEKLRRDLETLAHAFADSAARGLGLDVHYHANP